jgi:hypothetical protein
MTDPLTMPPGLDITSDEVRPVVRCGNRWLWEVRSGTDTAERAAEFIRRRFRQAYDARPQLTVPPLLAMTTAQGTLLAVVGVRKAGADRLFLEDYLDAPVEACLPGTEGCRESIVEIAHLAGVEVGVSRQLFVAMALWLEKQALDWVVCTGTSQLRNGFRQLGIDVADLGVADPARLVDGGRGWGRYYQHQPRVMAIAVPAGVKKLRQAGVLDKVSLMASASDQAVAERRIMGGGYGHTA